MNYFGLLKKKLSFTLIFSISFSLLIVLLNRSSFSINLVLLSTYGYVDLWHISNISSVIIWIFPQIFLIAYLGDYIEKNLLENSTLIFTRTNRRKKMLISFYFQILIITSLFYLIQFSILTVFALLKSQNIDLYIIVIYFRVMLYNYLIILIINIFSISSKSIYGVYAILIVQLSMLYLSSMMLSINPHFIKYIPTTIALISLTNLGIGLSHLNALLYVLAIIVVVYIISLTLFLKKEIIY